MLRSDLKDPLAPRQLHVTTLIADMEAYTSHVEHLPMEDAADLTRDFLECLTTPVLTKGGTLDKYTGDGLVAFWGAPLPVENHADLAVDAAIDIVNFIRENGMKSRVFALVHDSILAEVPEDELDIYQEKLRGFVQKDRGLSIPGFPIGCDFEIGDDYSFGKYEKYEKYWDAKHAV